MLAGRLGLVLVAAGLLAGCRPPVDDDSPPKPSTAVFQGSVDSRFVGRWKTANGRSALVMDKDGALTIESVIATPKGDTKTQVTGKWLVDRGRLLLQYVQTDQPVTVLPYEASLAGNKLTVVQAHGRLKTVYLRK